MYFKNFKNKKDGNSDNRYAACLHRGKSMLTRPEMAVVFVPDETISLGNDILYLDGCEIF